MIDGHFEWELEAEESYQRSCEAVRRHIYWEYYGVDDAD